MPDPNHIIYMKESVLLPNKSTGPMFAVKIAVWTIVAILLATSLILGENMFAQLSITTGGLLVALLIGTLPIGHERIELPSPMELQFYDTYMVLYRPKRRYATGVVRREFNLMYYSDITSCVYKVNTRTMRIFGTVHATWYNFNAEGAMSQTPTYQRTVKNAGLIFSILAGDKDPVAEIEEYSPIRVEIKK